MGAKRRFSREFKIEAVQRVLEGRRASEVASELGINAEVLRRWKHDLGTAGAKAFPGHGRPKAENEELVALRRENARLREERDFLKKAAAYFAKLERRGSK